ncbi:MAG TPA: glycosyltransferase family 2 protein [Bryobacteraceae bacterium]|nr:glycosyltransferase family 2 protein [Bryobacteraceae bacterium]
MPSEYVFWLAVAVPVYAYLGYPLILALLTVVIRRPVRRAPVPDPDAPMVSLLIPAYREAAVIEEKIRNSLALDYPADRLEIVVACDGSPDETPALARRMADGHRVRVLDYPMNRGKMNVLNASIPELRGEIVVFSDAAALLYPDAVSRLVSNFADTSVGAASGKYTVVKADEVSIGRSEDFYWRYETVLKVMESRISSTLGAHGHLHAIRKALYPFPPPGTINDDYIIPASVIARGYRAVYDSTAIVYEAAQEMTGFGRRVRIMAGNVQQLREIKPLLWPPRILPLYFFLSHKAVRLAVPFAMAVALVANVMLAGMAPYNALLTLQVAFYLLAIAGAVWKLRPRLLALPYYFTMINVAVFFGLYHALTSRRRMSWE